ncbi:MAG TPA: CBS domain-containing protein [Acidimicrobiales bacterium]|nr:CBS domain-containing protein [Acidimicrobiales bacterium]
MTNRSFEGLDATIGGLHLQPPTIVSGKDSLASVASAMVTAGVSCAILSEPPLRVVTEFDLTRGLALGLRPEDEVAPIASENPNWAPPSASVAEAAALMVSLGIRHLVVLDISERPSGVVSMAQLFDVLVRTQEPMALYAKFADIMLHGGHGTPPLPAPAAPSPDEG